MNLIQRRRLLKRANYLDLIPVRVHQHKLAEDGKVVLIVPKFKNEHFARWFIPKRKSIHYTVRFDELGSYAWLAIDGKTSVGGIAEALAVHFEINIEEARKRLTIFFTMLYDQRHISFTILQEG